MKNDYYEDGKVGLYLNRINYQGNACTNLETLKLLQWQHLMTVPYENLDILNNIPLNLNADALFDKIVMKQRGGYCFELNGAFIHLLKSLGFSVKQYAGRFMDTTGIIKMRTHRILLVSLEKERYMCDVGVRTESPRYPLLLTEETVQTDGVCEYRFRKDHFFGWILMRKEQGKEWMDLFAFTEEEQLDDDYVMLSYYCEKHPDSQFNKFMKVSLFLPDHMLNILENDLWTYRNANKEGVVHIKNNDEAIDILTSDFGIVVPDSYRTFLV